MLAWSTSAARHAASMTCCAVLAAVRGGALGAAAATVPELPDLLAATQLDGRLHRRLNPSDLVQEAMLAAHRDFEKFRGCSEREFLAWLRQILINCLHHAIETHVKAKRRDVRCEISMEQVSAALDRSAIDFAQSWPIQDRRPVRRCGNANGRWPWRISWPGSGRNTAT